MNRARADRNLILRRRAAARPRRRRDQRTCGSVSCQARFREAEIGLERYRWRIRPALIYGCVAKGTATAASDLDLLIVGDLALSDISLALAEAEQRLGGRVSPVTYCAEEFRSKLAGEDHFFSTLIERPKLFLIGDEGMLNEPRIRESRKPRARRPA